MSELPEHLRFYEELGVTRHQPGSQVAAARTRGVAGRPGRRARRQMWCPLPSPVRAAEALAAIRDDIGECTRCKLHAQGRKQIVFGVGNPTPT